jgi:hypothetical protein
MRNAEFKHYLRMVFIFAMGADESATRGFDEPFAYMRLLRLIVLRTSNTNNRSQFVSSHPHFGQAYTEEISNA